MSQETTYLPGMEVRVFRWAAGAAFQPLPLAESCPAGLAGPLRLFRAPQFLSPSKGPG